MTDRSAWIPKSLDGRYELARRLEGGRSVAWVLRDVQSGREDLVLKTWPVSQAHYAHWERLGLTTLSSAEGVGRILCSGHEAGRAWIARELVDGVSLEDKLRDGPLPVVDVLSLGVAVSSALERLHSIDIIHRDIKPSNVILRSGMASDAVLVDYELSGILDEYDKVLGYTTGAGELFGSPYYMSPEQLVGHKQSRATDVFGLGLLLLEAATGRLDVKDVSSLHELLVGRVSGEPFVDEAPESIRALLGRMLSRVPAQRPALREVKHELARIHQGFVQRARRESETEATIEVAGALVVSAASLTHPKAGVQARMTPGRIGLAAAAMLGFVVLLSAANPALLWLILPLSPAFAFAGYRWWLKRRVPSALEADLAVLSQKPRSKSELSRSVAIHVERVVARLRGLDRAKGETVLVLWQECMALDDPIQRAEVISKFFDTLGQLHVLVAPWYVRHEKLITVIGALATVMSTVVGVAVALRSLVSS